MYKERLLTPGPTQIPQRVLQSMDVSMLHHRSDVFKKELRRAVDGMRWLLAWDSDPIFLACSGTGAMEAALLNTCSPGDSVITVNGGSFGARWGKIAERLQLKVLEIQVDWGAAVSVEQVRAVVSASTSAKAFCIQHSETSTTVLHPVEAVLREVKRLAPRMLTVVDGISSCATTPMPGSPELVDVYIAGSQKALMLPAGLSVMALSRLAWEVVETTPKRTLYFDLAGERKALQGGETSWTPAATIIVGLNSALDMLKEEGLDAVIRRHELLSRVTRRGLAALGCRILAPDAPCPSVTGFFPPEGVDADKLRSTVRSDFGVRLAGGQGQLLGKVVRVGHMGYIDAFDVLASIAAIGLSLKKLGASVDTTQATDACLAEIAL